MKNLVILFFINCLFSCKAQTQKNNCEVSYENAKAKLKNYSKTSDDKYLDSAHFFLDNALICNETRRKSVRRKIEIFIMQGKYELGVKFVTTLNNQDFDFPYQCQMMINYLTGLYYAETDDLNKKDSVFKKSIYNIQNYIYNQNSKTFLSDSVAYYDLYFPKSRIYDSVKILKDIDSLKKKFPNDKDAIDRMKMISIENIGH
jgi:hypothetical protein